MLVVGARPQFVKAAALLGRPLAEASWLLVHTGQHYDYEISAAFFAELALPEPAHHLGVAAQGPAAQLAEMTGRLAEVIADEAPAAVVVGGPDDEVEGERDAGERPVGGGEALPGREAGVGDDQQVDVAVLVGLPGRMAAEEADPLRVEPLDDPSDDLTHYVGCEHRCASV